MAIQDYFLGKVKKEMQQPSVSPVFQKGMEADAAFLTPFFNMPSQVNKVANPPTPATNVSKTNASSGTAKPNTPSVDTAMYTNPFDPSQKVDKANYDILMESFGAVNKTAQDQVGKQFGVTDTKDTEKDLFSIFGMDSADPNSLYDKFGITQPDYQAPDSQEYQDLLKKQKELGDMDRRDQIKQYYEQELKRIEGDYEIRRQQLAKDVENSRQERISSLYDVGVVNPLSSGLASIGTASDEYKREQENLLNQKEAVEKQLAYAQFYDMETKELNRRLESVNASIEAHQEAAQAEYKNQVDAFSRSVQMVDKLISVWKENNRVSEKERSDAQSAFDDLVKNFGSAAFNGMDSSDIAEMESALGYPAGSLQSGIMELKKNELKDAPMDLRTVGGSLYSIERDADGNIVPTLIIAKPAGGGSGTNTTDKNLKAMFNDAEKLLGDLAEGKLDWGQAYNKIAAQYPDFAIPDSSGKTVIDDALGGSAGYDPQTGTYDSSKATGYAKPGNSNYKLTPEQVTKYYSAAYDYEKKKLDTGKIPDNVRNEVIERYGSDVAAPSTTKKSGGFDFKDLIPGIGPLL